MKLTACLPEEASEAHETYTQLEVHKYVHSDPYIHTFIHTDYVCTLTLKISAIHGMIQVIACVRGQNTEDSGIAVSDHSIN